LKYPSNWNLIEDTPSSQRFRGDRGFLEIKSLAGNGMTLDQIAQSELNNELYPFGSTPRIVTQQIGGLEGMVILPSTDQPRLDPTIVAWGKAIVAFPRPVMINNTLYDFFILEADLSNLDAIVSSIIFEDANLAREKFPAESESPASGICAQQAGTTIQVMISTDVPSPRCIQVEPYQMLKVVNGAGVELEIKLGWYKLSLQPNEERNLNVPVSAYLAPGVHRIEVLKGFGNGPEIWVMGSA